MLFLRITSKDNYYFIEIIVTTTYAIIADNKLQITIYS